MVRDLPYGGGGGGDAHARGRRCGGRGGWCPTVPPGAGILGGS